MGAGFGAEFLAFLASIGVFVFVGSNGGEGLLSGGAIMSSSLLKDLGCFRVGS